MKAIVCMRYGLDNLRFEEVPKPVPGDGEVLVKIHASSVNFSILAYVGGRPLFARLWGIGLLRPKARIPGGDVAGRVEAVGRNTKQFQPGDDVFGNLAASGFGAFAEYVSAPESALALKPANVSFEEAAATVQAAVIALQGLRNQRRIQPGERC